jgi:hypothetical protein
MFLLPQFLPDLESLPPYPQISPQNLQVFHTWTIKYPHHLETLHLMRAISRFSSHLKLEAINTKRRVFSDGDFGIAYLFPLIHKCLSLPRYNEDLDEKDGAILQACRLACALFLAEIKRMFGINAVNSGSQTQKLRTYLANSKGHWGDLQPLRLWCLAMGGVESLESLQVWYEHELREEGANMGLDSWKEVENEVKAILWFDECHTSLLVEWGLDIKEVSGLNALGGRSYASHNSPLR